jgi:hypothetical protein
MEASRNACQEIISPNAIPKFNSQAFGAEDFTQVNKSQGNQKQSVILATDYFLL